MPHPKGGRLAALDFKAIASLKLGDAELEAVPGETPHVLSPRQVEQSLEVIRRADGTKDLERRGVFVRQHAAQHQRRKSKRMVGVEVTEQDGARRIQPEARLGKMDRERRPGIEQNASIDQD